MSNRKFILCLAVLITIISISVYSINEVCSYGNLLTAQIKSYEMILKQCKHHEEPTPWYDGISTDPEYIRNEALRKLQKKEDPKLADYVHAYSEAGWN